MNEEEIRGTPMGRVWLFVFLSIAISATVMFAWHSIRMREVRQNHAAEVEGIQKDIAAYKEYLRTLRASSTDEQGRVTN